MAAKSLSHLDDGGAARMVDVSGKDITRRVARASGWLRTTREAAEALAGGDLPKGDALGVARVAGILAAKQTPSLIPLCHPLPIDHVAVQCSPDLSVPGVLVTSEVVVTARTGAEMEALAAVSAALLSLYDMVKALDRGATINDVRVDHKSGGRGGVFDRREQT